MKHREQQIQMVYVTEPQLKWTYYADTDWFILWKGHLESRVWRDDESGNGNWIFRCWWHGMERENGERVTSTSARLAAEDYLLHYKPQRKTRPIKPRNIVEPEIEAPSVWDVMLAEDCG